VLNVGFGLRRRGALAATVLAGSLLLGGATALAQDTVPGSLSGSIASDGSSTVGPLTQAVAEEFIAVAPDVQISVDISGTGGGFERFCDGEIDVQNASRAIKAEEAAKCAENGVDWYQFEVAYDGVTVVTNKENTWATCLTTEQLQQLWQKENPATTWADLNPEWPAETINLYGPGTDSGTFDFFVETILGEDDIREDFNPSEDDNVLVSGVGGDINALGYFGLAYYEANQDTLNAVAIDNATGECVAPTPESVQDGTYAPLSRPLFVYISAASLERPEVQEFTRFYLQNAAALAPEVGYVASPEEVYAADLEAFEADVAGEGTPDSQQIAATPAT
jgi:phosphate transport system substrate-binding protein